MNHLDFIVWMMLFPAAMALPDVMRAAAGAKIEDPPEWAKGVAAWITLTLWLGGGYLLW